MHIFREYLIFKLTDVNLLLMLTGMYAAHLLGVVVQGGKYVLAIFGIAWVAGFTLITQLDAVTHEGQNSKILEQLGQFRLVANDALKDVRAIVHTLHPNALSDLGLVGALHAMADAINAWSEALVEINLVEGTSEEAKAIPHDQAAVLYRVAQEAIHNALKHADADHITITVEIFPSSAALRVADDGDGFDVGDVVRQQSGPNLLMLQERVTLAGGTFEVTSIPKHGTYLYASIPYDTVA